MSYLKSNLRKKSLDVDFDAIGGGFANWNQGSSLFNDRHFGGFVWASFASQLSGAGFLAESAFDFFSSGYGATMASNLLIGGSGGSSPQLGMKIIPFAFMDFSGNSASGSVFYTLSTTNAIGNDDSVVIITPKVMTISGPQTSASNVSVHFVMVGLVTSTPFAYH